VKFIKVSQTKGEPGVVPSIQTVHDKTYPISRPMFMYTPPNPPQHVTDYLNWVVTDAGQKIVEATGYVPLPKK
jgi:phosphate transport system substrate-binding protein